MAITTAVREASGFKDILGQKFGRLLVIAEAGKNISGQVTWLCRCDCGKLTTQAGSTLRGGKVVSCGCYNREATAKRATTHGMCSHPLYEHWHSMISLVSESYHAPQNYSERGIVVCERWKEVKNFIDDMYPIWRPNQQLTLERKDVNGNYCPENCTWATTKEQANNRRTNRHIEYNGRTWNFAELAAAHNMSAQALRYRVDTQKLPLEEALLKPKRGYNKTGEWVGKSAIRAKKAKGGA